MPNTTKFDLRTEALRPVYASIGATDVVVEAVRDYATDVRKLLAGVQKDVSGRVAEVQKSVSTRVSETQKAVADAKPADLRDQAVTAVSARVEALSKDAKARREAVNGAYDDLTKRGEFLVARIRNQQATQDTVAAGKTTVAKAKTTRTQARKTAGTARSSAKATTTAAKKTASQAARAVADAAEKVGG